MQGKKGIRYKAGITLIVLGMISPLFSFFVPFFDLPTAVASTVVALLMVGGPEVFLIAGGLLAGKEALESVKSKLFQPAGKIRYTLGMVLFASALLTNWVLVYLALTDVVQMDQQNLLIIIGGIDIVTISSILLMGVEFFAKFKRLFIFEGVKKDS